MPETLELPPALDPDLLYSSTGEDKGDDVNFAIGVRSPLPPGRRAAVYRALEDWLTPERCEDLLGVPCSVVPFPTVHSVNVLVRGVLRNERFDKQGKGLGRRLLESLRRRRTPSD